MTEEHVSKKFSDKGLTTGTKAPDFDTIDTNEQKVNLYELLKADYDGILIDFFRGAW